MPCTTAPVGSYPSTTVPVASCPSTTVPVASCLSTTVPVASCPSTTAPVGSYPSTNVPGVICSNTTVPLASCPSTTSLPITVQTTLGVDEFDSNTFKVYPNPVSHLLNLKYSKVISNVKVFNLIGQEVFDKNINTTSTSIDMEKFANGTYFINVSSNDGSKTIKIVKE